MHLGMTLLRSRTKMLIRHYFKYVSVLTTNSKEFSVAVGACFADLGQCWDMK